MFDRRHIVDFDTMKYQLLHVKTGVTGSGECLDNDNCKAYYITIAKISFGYFIYKKMVLLHKKP